MDPRAFAETAQTWHDFYLAVSGATAALLGLLFVGVSINLGAIAATERVDLRARAGQAFANLLFVLIIALMLLIPDPDPRAIALGLAIAALLGLLRLAGNLVEVYRGRSTFRNQLQTVRRIGWTVIADAILLVTAAAIWTGSEPNVLTNLVWAVFVLLIGAADVAWEILVDVSRETPSS
jgi:modulator of FtsH protease